MTKHSPLRSDEVLYTIKHVIRQHHHGVGLLTLVACLFVLSFVAGLRVSVQDRTFTAGEILADDVVAHRTLQVMDGQATKARRDQVAALQPAVFDLSTIDVGNIRDQVFALFLAISEDRSSTEAGLSQESPPNIAGLRDRLNKDFGISVPLDVLYAWMKPEVQEFVLAKALPWVDKNLSEGVVSNIRGLLPYSTGIIVRNLETGMESLRTEVTSIRDIPTLLMAMDQMLRTEGRYSIPERRAIVSLFSPLLVPTLTLNREATLNLGNSMAQSVEPVYYYIQKGELIASKGERITREKQLKLQALFSRSESLVQSRTVAGTFLISLVLVLGIFVAPSGRTGSVVQKKDFMLIALLLLCFGLSAKILYVVGNNLLTPQELSIAAYGFPVAGALGLSTLIFAARRYSVVGLLTAFFCTLMFKGGIPLFFFYFLTSMLNTWLILRAQSRQDVVRSIFPMCVGLLPIVVGSGWLEGFQGGDTFLVLGGYALVGAILSLFILFAISPILEFLFRYTTRFRLMELMSLEQPLMQELMVAMPGTYHHSLLVSNMVEAGAKAVGANSLLCKVGALYHDIGKLAYPDYFIENQTPGMNRHDKLAPAMSALILTSHVKKGIELAAQHRLGTEIEEIIRQHHGTSLMQYFYKKAQDLGDAPRREEFCYAGPRPQSREAAIVMLADAVEASSRTLSDPTPARIKTHVDTIMKGIFSDGQLDESELTFKDLNKLSEHFARSLTGLFHQRIAYPEITKEKVVQGKKTDNKSDPKKQECVNTAEKAHADNGPGKNQDMNSTQDSQLAK